MAYTTPATGNILKKWETDYFAEYVRESGFNPYMGSGTNSPFVVKKQLIQGGQVITVPLVSALTGSNVGTGTLVGNEESLGNYSYDLKPYWHRYAVAIKKSDEQNSVIDLLNASRDMLKVRDMDDMRDSIKECIPQGIGNEADPWGTIELADLGYCEIFDFKCAASRTCDAWVVGGPNTGEAKDEDMEEGEDYEEKS